MRAAVFIAVMIALAGCSSSSPPVHREAPDSTSPIYTEPEPEPVEFEGDAKAFLLESRSDLAGFSFDVPSGVTQAPFNDYELTFEVQGDVNQALALVFSNGLLAAVVAWVPYEETVLVSPSGSTTQPGVVDWGPRTLTLFDTQVGSSLEVVFASSGGNSALRVDFLTGTPLEEHQRVVGNGTEGGFQIRQWTELLTTLLATTGQAGVVTLTGDPTVDDLVPMASGHAYARDTEVIAECDLGGWGYAETLVGLMLEAEYVWRHSLEAGGQEAAASGVYSTGGLLGYIATAVTFGLPDGFAYGPGAAEATMRLIGAEVPAIHLASVTSICLSSSLEDLGLSMTGSQLSRFEGVVTLPPVIWTSAAAGPTQLGHELAARYPSA